MFKSNLENKPLNLKGWGILGEGFSVFKKLFFEPENWEPVSDQHGVYAYIFRDLILVAKKETYADIVSVTKELWDRASQEGKKIVIYIASSGYFYRFDPEKVKETETNFRGKIEMVNFSIREGVNLMKLKAQKEKVNIIVLKNKVEELKCLFKEVEMFKDGVFG